MSSPRLIALLVAGVAIIVSGCADDESGNGHEDPAKESEAPSGESPAGAYGFAYTVTESTIKTVKPGPKSRDEAVLFWSCEDQDCSTLFQRADSVGWSGWTVRLTPTADGYVGTHTRRGDCPEGAGRFREDFTWSWSRVEGGALEGTLNQEFTGCQLDGTSTRQGTATPDASQPLPYLDDLEAGQVAATLTRYDATVASVYDEFPKCLDLGEGTARSARCFEAMFRGWEQEVRNLASSLSESVGPTEGVCNAAIERLDLDGFAAAMHAASRDYTIEEGNEAVERAGRQHDFLARIALMCVPPEDYATLGDNGTLALDIYGAVPPESN